VKKSLSVLLIILFCAVPLVQANATNFEIYASTNKGPEMFAAESMIIEGVITNFDEPLVGGIVYLQWINPDGTSEKLTTNSDSQGRFQFIFTPTKIGQSTWRCYIYGTYTPYSTINVVWETTPIPTLTMHPTPTASQSNTPTTTSPVTQTPDPNIFSLQSNSTASGFSFDSTNQELRFNVTGPTGTMGCTNVTIAKSFLANIDNLKVYLDGNPIDCNIISSDTFWLLSFTYHHSTHQVKISLSTDEPAFFDITLAGVILTVILVAVLLTVLGTIVHRKKQLMQK
jgi:hypothetical protein